MGKDQLFKLRLSEISQINNFKTVELYNFPEVSKKGWHWWWKVRLGFGAFGWFGISSDSPILDAWLPLDLCEISYVFQWEQPNNLLISSKIQCLLGKYSLVWTK
jgi:hypothetical protein